MLFFYVRHGDPIYNPDSLTPKGEREAEALGKRLAIYGIDEIFTSSSTRAILTAKPTCELLKKESIPLDFCHEKLAYRDFSIQTADGGSRWMYQHDEVIKLFISPEIRKLDNEWYTHPALSKTNAESGWKRVSENTDSFLLSLGYEHIREENRYKVIEGTDENKRVALFAHEGFGLAFLSAVLDIPYPMISTHFHYRTSGFTVISFKHDSDGYSIPMVYTHSNDSHLYREGLPLIQNVYNGKLTY